MLCVCICVCFCLWQYREFREDDEPQPAPSTHSIFYFEGDTRACKEEDMFLSMMVEEVAGDFYAPDGYCINLYNQVPFTHQVDLQIIVK